MATRSVARQRKVQRLVHLTAGLLLAGYVYVPIGQRFEDLVRLVVLPLLALTGMLMWQAARIRRMLKRGRRRGHGAPSSSAASEVAEAGPALSQSPGDRARA
jgi:hypothetical protein